MPRGYKGDKRRREIAKKKKRQEKLDRKRSGSDNPEGEDKSYLEYLHPGGLPEELQEQLGEDDDSDDDEEEVDSESDED
jgi:hypothetical protein